MAYADKDNRQLTSHGGGFCKKVTVDVVINGTTGETTITDMNHYLCNLMFVVPALTGAHTAVLTIENEDDHDYYASASLAESASHSLTAERRLVGDVTFKVVTSGAESDGAVIFYVYLYGD